MNQVLGLVFFFKICFSYCEMLMVLVVTATYPAPTLHIPMGQIFLFLIFETKIQKSSNAMTRDIHWTFGYWYCFIKNIMLDSLKIFVTEKGALSSTSTQIL